MFTSQTTQQKPTNNQSERIGFNGGKMFCKQQQWCAYNVHLWEFLLLLFPHSWENQTLSFCLSALHGIRRGREKNAGGNSRAVKFSWAYKKLKSFPSACKLFIVVPQHHERILTHSARCISKVFPYSAISQHASKSGSIYKTITLHKNRCSAWRFQTLI